MDGDYIRKRITQLRVKKGVSEYKMSLDLGHSRSYVQNISSGRSLPSMQEFLAICEYFNITARDFFDDEIKDASLFNIGIEGLRKLGEDDLFLVIGLINRLKAE